MSLHSISPARRKLAELIETDRAKIANNQRALRAAALIGSRARRAALSAWRSGHSPIIVASNVITQSLPDVLLRMMVAAHLMGRRRGVLNVAPQLRRKHLSLSAYDEAIIYLKHTMKLSDADLAKLGKLYQPESLKVARIAADGLSQELARAIEECTRQGLGTQGGAKLIADAFEKAGITPAAPYQLQTIFRTQTQLAYSAGRWNSQQDPAIQEILWGYEYCTVGDDRVRPEHAEMEGFKAPVNDPIWNSWTPPCGYNCRCTLLEVFKEDTALADASSRRDVRPDKGWDFNPGKLFADMLTLRA